MTMSRTPPWAAVLAVGLSIGAVVVVGCNNGKPAPPAGAVASKGPEEAPKAPAGPKSAPKWFLGDWPADLAAVLMISGEMDGYMEPCGCTEGQKGGLIRRMAFADQVRTEGKWPLGLIDLGGLLNDPGTHGGLEETKIRFVTALKALTMLKYSAVGSRPTT